MEGEWAVGDVEALGLFVCLDRRLRFQVPRL